jgi:hypothetical protein
MSISFPSASWMAEAPLLDTQTVTKSLEETHVPAFSTGDRVVQSQFGNGTVLMANDYHTVIDFDDHGSRTFSTPLVHLAPSSTPAPPKPVRKRRTTKATAAQAK